MPSFHLAYVGALGVMLSLSAALSSSSLFICWVSMELNLLGFLAFFLSKQEEGGSAAMSYFVIQSASSSLFLGGYLLFGGGTEILTLILLVSVYIKLGAVPFHLWFIALMSKVSWYLFFLLATLQKMLPLYLALIFQKSEWGQLTVLLSAATAAMASTGLVLGKTMMAYSSVYSVAWLLGGGSHMKTSILFLMVYSLGLLLLVSGLQSVEWLGGAGLNGEVAAHGWGGSAIVGLWSLAGLPPLAGFYAKVWVLQETISHNQIFVSAVLLFTAVYLLYLYMRLSLSVLVGKSPWLMKFKVTSLSSWTIIMLASISLAGGVLF